MSQVGARMIQFDKHGTWCNVADRKKTVSGTLAYSPSTGLRLTTASVPALADRLGGDDPIVLNGLVDGQYWTLADAFCTSRSNSAQEFHIGYAFAGLGLDVNELTQLDELRLEFDGLWSTIRLQPRGPSQLDRPSVSVFADIGGGWTIELASDMVELDVSGEAAFGFRDRIQFVCRTSEPTDFPQLIRAVLTPLRDLLIIAHQCDIAVSSCSIGGPGTVVPYGSRTRREHPIAFWNHITRSDLDGAEARSSLALRIPTAADEFEPFIRNWFDLHRLLETPIALRVADLTTGMSFSEPRFLLAAQSLEALHRRLHPDATDDVAANARDAAIAAVADEHRRPLEIRLKHAHEPSFRTRIKQLVAEVQPQASAVVGSQLSKAIARVVDLRNAVTHWDPSKETYDGVQFVAMRLLVDAIFDLVLLRRLGLDDDALDATATAHSAKHVEYWVGRALAAAK